MPFTSGGCRDLRQQMNNPQVLEAFGKLISGRSGYTPIIERRQEPLICSDCNYELTGEEKFCPECGKKVEKKDN